MGHFEDNLLSQSLDWSKTPSLLNQQLAGKNNTKT